MAIRFTAAGIAAVLAVASAWGQSVCLPAPRLLLTTPMGGQRGATVEVLISGENLDDVESLQFSHPGVTAVPKVNDAGAPVANTYLVTIAADCPAGLYEARVMTRLGLSSSRVFNVGTLPELTRAAANTSLEKATPLPLDTVCNAYMTQQSVDHYACTLAEGQRVVVDCAAKGIDSKLTPVLIVADEQGNDLQVERRGGVVDFTAPRAGTYIIKVHDLTFTGGREHFYRLVAQTAAADEAVPRLPGTRRVNEFSWPPPGLAVEAATTEVEPNDAPDQAQRITLPCDIAGSFYPAADVDTFEFTASKGEVWWVEVASERLGRPTDPSAIVQHVRRDGETEVLTDVAELTDIPSPVKVSSNGYSYDGPPYNPGSSDILGKLEIKEDGLHRLQLRDLFGGTRSDPRNVYRLVIRRAQPDFAVVGWALHMELRNGDRNALSKPITLRGGTTAAFEVAVIRRDGFDGPVSFTLDNLPEGVTATGLTIPAGKTRGILLITAAEDAPRGLSSATFTGRAEINGETVTRQGAMASMAWPVTNAWSEIPSPRLLADVPVSVCGAELAPITVRAAEEKIWETPVGGTLTIPLIHVRRSEFSGPKMSLKTFGEGFESLPAFDVGLNDDASTAVLDLSKLKTPPGEYTVAFYGSAVAKYRYHPEAATFAELQLKRAQEAVAAIETEAKGLQESLTAATEEQKSVLEQQAQAAAERLKSAKAEAAEAEKRLKDAAARSAPKDTVDIIVTPPIRIRVTAGEEAAQK